MARNPRDDAAFDEVLRAQVALKQWGLLN